VIVPRISVLLIAAAAGEALAPSHAHAQWWSRAPADFEECADIAEKVATKEARASALTECNAKFAGRRKPGGGYSYFDFMQNRSFDIAGPNPTPAEQKQIDQQYTAYLDRERRSSIAAAFTAKQQQQLQQASLRNETEKASPPPQPPPSKPRAAGKPAVAPTNIRPHVKGTNCAQPSFSCEWPRLSEKIDELKKALFGAPPPQNALPQSKAKRS
jgi:hypothetical protein